MRQFNELLEDVRGNQNKQYSDKVKDDSQNTSREAQGINEGEPQEQS
jgi:hypothetical protein